MKPLNRTRRLAKEALRHPLRAIGWVAVALMLAPIAFYQRCITPYTPPACRFTPTCSEYARQALLRHGPLKGLLLAIWRILRCNPWGGQGYDPVPPEGQWTRPFHRHHP